MKLKAATLLETSIVLTIIGFLLLSAYKGVELLNKVKLDKIKQNIILIEIVIKNLDSNSLMNNNIEDLIKFELGPNILETNLNFKINLIKEKQEIFIILNNLNENQIKYFLLNLPNIEINNNSLKYKIYSF